MPTFGCANGVCKVLNKSGIDVGSGISGSGIFSSETLQDMIQNGFASQGRRLEVELFSTRVVSVDELVANAAVVDTAWTVVVVVAVPVGIEIGNALIGQSLVFSVLDGVPIWKDQTVRP